MLPKRDSLGVLDRVRMPGPCLGGCAGSLGVGDSMMKRLALAAAIAASTAVGAHAADLRVAPAYGGPIVVVPYQWSGFYIGANLGGHFGHDKVGPAPFNVTLDPSGVIGGLQGGYNWQFGAVVAGVEVDTNWLSGTANSPFSSTNAEFLLTARGRLGWAVWDRALFYVTGGYAFANVNFNDGVAVNGVVANSTVTPHRTGWTIGTGFEYGLTDAWSVKAEYLYVDLGTYTNNVPAPFSAGFTHQYTDNIVRAGVNYRFGAF
jgi:outer membrane immunogenic protein